MTPEDLEKYFRIAEATKDAETIKEFNEACRSILKGVGEAAAASVEAIKNAERRRQVRFYVGGAAAIGAVGLIFALVRSGQLTLKDAGIGGLATGVLGAIGEGIRRAIVGKRSS